MVLTNEIISLSRKFVAGVRLDDEVLALDIIHQVGPGGDFLSHDHTLDHWQDLWVPKLFNRQRLDAWQAQGGKDINARLREVAIGLMDRHRVESLPDSVETEIEAILKD